MAKTYLFATILVILVLVLSCSQVENKPSGAILNPVNPNGDSELALLMRAMFDDGVNMKAQIKEGKIPESILEYEKIHTASATEPEKAASAEFKAYSEQFLSIVKKLKTSDEGQVEHFYTQLVHSCMGCHQAMCPGPMVKIKKMYLDYDLADD